MRAMHSAMLVVVVVLDRTFDFGSDSICLHPHDKSRRWRACRDRMRVFESMTDSLGEWLGRGRSMWRVQPLDRHEVRLPARPGS